MQFPHLLVFSTGKMMPCPEFVAQTSDDQEALNSFLMIPDSGIILVSLRKPETKKSRHCWRDFRENKQTKIKELRRRPFHHLRRK